MPDEKQAASLSPEQQRLVDLVIERAEQGCRLALKHHTFGHDDESFQNGWEDAAEVCERAIRPNVMSHIAEDIANA
jgi:hypothetical protein